MSAPGAGRGARGANKKRPGGGARGAPARGAKKKRPGGGARGADQRPVSALPTLVLVGTVGLGENPGSSRSDQAGQMSKWVHRTYSRAFTFCL
jgi:hypothetical protein